MSVAWEPPPSADQIMRHTAMWVAQLFGVQIEYTIDDGRGSVGTTVIDRRKVLSDDK